MDSKLALGSLAVIAAIAGNAHTAPVADGTPARTTDEALYDIDTAAQKAPAANSALDHILKSLHLRVCVRSDVAPFGYFSTSALEGFDIDLATEITRQISIDYKQALRPTWTVVAVDERMKRLQDNSCDIMVADFSYSKERAAQIGTSKVYLRTDKVLVTAAKLTRKVAVIAKVAGATGDAGALKGTMRAFATYQEIVHAMDAGEIDYVITDRPIAEHLIRSSVTAFQITKTLAENAESYVVGVNLNNPDVLAAVNKALDDLARSGRLALLVRRWL
jgi:putative glutamine transport system substrate-binding protein